MPENRFTRTQFLCLVKSTKTFLLSFFEFLFLEVSSDRWNRLLTTLTPPSNVCLWVTPRMTSFKPSSSTMASPFRHFNVCVFFACSYSYYSIEEFECVFTESRGGQRGSYRDWINKNHMSCNGSGPLPCVSGSSTCALRISKNSPSSSLSSTSFLTSKSRELFYGSTFLFHEQHKFVTISLPSVQLECLFWEGIVNWNMYWRSMVMIREECQRKKWSYHWKDLHGDWKTINKIDINSTRSPDCPPASCSMTTS